MDTPKEYKEVRVHWEDATHRSGWHSVDELQDIINEGFMVETLGWLVHEDDDCIVVAQSVSRYRMAELSRIPKAYIKDRMEIANS